MISPAKSSQLRSTSTPRRHVTHSPALPSRSFPTESRDAQIVALLHEFKQCCFRRGEEQLHVIEHALVKHKYLSEEKKQFLHSHSEECKTFMKNMGIMLEEAAMANYGIEQSVLQNLSKCWDDGKRHLSRLEAILQACGGNDALTSVSSVSVTQHAHQKSVRGSCDTPTGCNRQRCCSHSSLTSPGTLSSRTSSPARGIPRLSDIHLLHRSAPQLSNGTFLSSSSASLNSPPRGSKILTSSTPIRQSAAGDTTPTSSSGIKRSSAHPILAASSSSPHPSVPSTTPQRSLPLEDRREILESIDAMAHSFSTSGLLSAEDSALVKQYFTILYGSSDGHRRFQRWCDDQMAAGLRRR